MHGDKPAPQRPDTPLSETSLLTGTRADPSLVSQLKRELASADRVDIIALVHQVERDRPAAGCARSRSVSGTGTELRVLTTSYMGATDVEAVRFLSELPNTTARVSYDTHRTRLHAKAYLFERATGFSTAYVGSANLSRPALTEGLEWTLKVTQYADAPIWDKVQATFETYWNDPEFEPFDEAKLRDAIEEQRSPAQTRSVVPAFELHPFQFQEEILERLAAERGEGNSPHRQLVVAATGTGKTMIAAFDYQRQVRDAGGRYPALLFVAHRREILHQSLDAFRAVLRDQNFGDLLDGQSRPKQTEHLFVTVQTLYQRSWIHTHDPAAYEYVVIDETHRSAATSYQGLLDHVRPHVLLGLTATPERADGEDILRYFDGRVSAEIRLPDAINRRLVVPFHYYGVADNVDYSKLHWERGGYRVSEIDNLVTGNHVRAREVLDQCQKRLRDVHAARGLGFCVTVAHAEFMADFFKHSGIPAIALSADSPRHVRDDAQRQLRERTVNFIFAVDLYNEGVDIPEVDTILFLRPTESLPVFLQQLGRGLRLTPDKDFVTVLDFVGRMHRNFRFDRRLRAMLTDNAGAPEKEIEHGFPHLPAGCAIELERVAQDRVLENIRQSLLRGQSAMIRDLAGFESETGEAPTFGRFLEYHGLTPDDIYRRMTWTRARSPGGTRRGGRANPDETVIRKWLRRIAHADDRLRLERWREWLADGDGDDPLVLALCLPLIDSRVPTRITLGDAWALLQRNPAHLDEARMLVGWLLSRPGGHPASRAEATPDLDFALHGHYTREEILALTGERTWDHKPHVQEGVRHIGDRKLDVFMVTLNKTEKDYSPSTLYEDYAIDAQHFHWQSQSTTSEQSKTGQRYIHHEARGYRPLLFVREHKRTNGLAPPYAFLGPVVRAPLRRQADQHHLAAGPRTAGAPAARHASACRRVEPAGSDRHGCR
ncbi:MAG: DUF3427 domain-containing protein [Halofilum sp. (in: g-proteobacteria)]|nr:DUF3427 domain-containing protein [Halofilum sp. (in: g-proteobacteria)]